MPSPLWTDLALNPYGEQVQEDAHGQRQVATADGWRTEDQVAPHRVCRATSAEAGRLGMAAMGVPEVSASFRHQPARAFRIWVARRGTPWTQVPAPEPAQTGWRRFQAGVEQAMGDAGMRAWLSGRWGAPGLVVWPRIRNAPSATATRGLQMGLASRLLRVPVAQRGVVLEQGLVDSGDAATRLLPTEERWIRAQRSGPDARSPEFIETTTWTSPSVRSNLPSQRAVNAEVQPFGSVLLWATPQAYAAWGDQGVALWWAYFAQGGKGWVVFDRPDTPPEQALMNALRTGSGSARRWGLKEGPTLRGVVWEINLDPALKPGIHASAVDWNAWAPEPPKGKALLSLGEAEDEYGRVPYRAQSRLGDVEGVAPRRLESAMHSALAALVARKGPVDALVAQALGVSEASLIERLSPEQVDSVAAALDSLEQKRGFVVADETGFGKGRILAALALIGRRRGERVLFMTENAPLFSDLYRDLLAVSDNAAPLPFLLHGDATLRTPEGQKVGRSPTAKGLQTLLAAPPAEEAPPFIMTTYAQIARKQSENKQVWLKAWLNKTGWVLLDEAHNAAGDSQVNARLEKLLAEAGGAVYASATFAKGEGNLGLYAAALPPDRFVRRILRRALAGDQGLLRETLTQAMARDGRLMRREHAPIPPPETVWVPMTPERQRALDAFAATWRCLGLAVETAKPLTPDGQGVWAKLGAPMARTVREFGMWMKVEGLIETVAAAVAAGQKPVIATDSTLEAALREALLPTPGATAPAASADAPLEEEEDAAAAALQQPSTGRRGGSAASPMRRGSSGAPPLWRDRLRRMVAVAVPPSLFNGLPSGSTAGNTLRQQLAEVHAAIDALPDWTLSPIDALRDGLAARGVRCGELSGRQYRLRVNPQGWQVIDRGDGERALQVRDFNDGTLDALIISRAGSTGISLHAGKRFKDQRPRALYEWDVALNPVHRWQFRGRVRRRDQVCEPGFYSLWLDTPSERRIIEREHRKGQQMGAHMGATKQEPLGWLSPEGEAIVTEWATEAEGPARRLGVAWPMLDEPLGRVERALARSLMLTETEREGLVLRLTRGLDLAQDRGWRRRHDPVTLPSREVRRLFWWGHPQTPADDGGARLRVRRVDAVERCWAPEPPPSLTAVEAAVRAGMGHLATQGPAVLADWEKAWRAETQLGAPYNAGRRRAWTWASTHLPKMRAGQALFFTSPDTRAAVRAVILSLDAPTTPYQPGAASPWALSQVAVRVWAVGQSQPSTISLLALSEDAAFRLPEVPAQIAWFKEPAAPRVGVVMEGNVLAATDWGRRWGIGRAAMILDHLEGERVVWALPTHIRLEDLLTLPRDTIDTEHTLLFFRQHKDGKLSAALPPGQTLIAEASAGSLLLRMDAAMFRLAQETWFDFALQQSLTRVYNRGEATEVVLRCSWNHAPEVIGGLEARGIGWRVGPEHLAWYTKTSAERLGREAPLWVPKKSAATGSKGKGRRSR
jgi:hypothetical protein